MMRGTLLAMLAGCAAAASSTASLRPAALVGIKQPHSVLQLRGGGSLSSLPNPLAASTAVVQSLEATEVLHCDNLLGEAPMWHSQEEALYWLDINGEKMWRFHPASGAQKMWTLPEKVALNSIPECRSLCTRPVGRRQTP